MKQIEISHSIKYRYSKKVFLEPHIIKLIPRSSLFTTLVSSNINILPSPSSIHNSLELDGSISYNICFNGMTYNFYIEHKSIVKINSHNPFDFIVYPDVFLNIPFSKNLINNEYLYYLNIEKPSAAVKKFAVDLATKSNSSTFDFLLKLTTGLKEIIKYEPRELGISYSADKTLSLKKGSCRDIAALFIDICRYMNIPARFTSGYFLPEESDDSYPELHAWAEVNIPGAGWLGFDPTNGILCYGHHISLNSSYIPSKTLPITGSIRGNATSKMSYDLSIKLI